MLETPITPPKPPLKLNAIAVHMLRASFFYSGISTLLLPLVNINFFPFSLCSLFFVVLHEQW